MALRLLAIAFCGLLLFYDQAEGLVGGAPLATGEMARSVIGIIGPHDFFCTATAIASDLVLTAGHCMRPGPDYKVQYRDKSGSRSLFDIAIWQRPPQFAEVSKQRVTADLALLKLTNRLPEDTGIAALGLKALSIWPGDHFTVIGGGVAIKGLRETGINRVANLVVTAPFSSQQIRLVDPSGKPVTIGACFGDSGSPVFQTQTDGARVIAVVSWAGSNTKMTDCGGLTGATLLSPYRQWIEETVRHLRGDLKDRPVQN